MEDMLYFYLSFNLIIICSSQFKYFSCKNKDYETLKILIHSSIPFHLLPLWLIFIYHFNFTGCVDLFEVSEVQGVAGSSEKSGSKTPGSTSAASGSFLGSQQPYNCLGWNADISGSTKEKQEQVILMCEHHTS